MRTRLQQGGRDFKERVVPGGRLSQLFVPDPEGVLVEINFRNDVTDISSSGLRCRISV